MGKMRGFIGIVLAIVIVALIAGYAYLGILLDKGARRAIAFISTNLAKEGLKLENPDFYSIGLQLFPPGIVMRDFSSYMVLTKRNAFQINSNFSLNIKKISLSVGSIRNRTIMFMVGDAVVVMQKERGLEDTEVRGESGSDRLEIARLKVPFRIRSLSVSRVFSDAQSLLKEFARLAKNGTTGIAMTMSATSAFAVREKPVQGKLLLVPHEKGYRLVMDSNDFRMIASTLGERLTDAEFDVYCTNPFRLPRMLRIRNYASDEAMKAKQDDEKVPEEAYMHVLWAYLLATAYDASFSAEVTDSHEINALGKSDADASEYLRERRGKDESGKSASRFKSEAEIRMDLNNNLIGREYAESGYTEGSLLGRTMSDPRVVRDPSGITGAATSPVQRSQ